MWPNTSSYMLIVSIKPIWKADSRSRPEGRNGFYCRWTKDFKKLTVNLILNVNFIKQIKCCCFLLNQKEFSYSLVCNQFVLASLSGFLGFFFFLHLDHLHDKNLNGAILPTFYPLRKDLWVFHICRCSVKQSVFGLLACNNPQKITSETTASRVDI